MLRWSRIGKANPNDYPSRALREEREGVTRFTVNVGADGRVTSCQVTGSSGHADLDETTCRLIQRRGRFNPATDGEGNAVADRWSSAVRWEIPQ
ncbi:energy transducer TonB [Leptolyngbya sp. 15MV]|nr:energy transducer TonB [Leptolyngbya sp. 15MV]